MRRAISCALPVRNPARGLGAGVCLTLMMSAWGLVDCPSLPGTLTAATVPAPLPAEVAWTSSLEEAAAASPTSDDTRVYVPLANGQVVALSRVSGEPVWTTDLKTSWPLVVGEKALHAVSDATLVELDPDTGRVRQRHQLPGEASGPPTRIGTLFLIPVQPSLLVAWDPQQAKEVWRQTFDGPVTGAPVVSDNGATLIVAVRDRLAAATLSNGARRWTTVLEGTLTPPIVVGDRVIVGSTTDYVYVLDARGKYRWKLSGWADIVGLAADADQFYVASLDNIVRAIGLQSGDRRWRKIVTTRLAFPPQLVGSTLLVGGFDPALTALSSDGGVLGTHALPELDFLAVAPLVVDAPEPESVRLVLFTRRGEVFGLRRAPPKEEPRATCPAGQSCTPVESARPGADDQAK